MPILDPSTAISLIKDISTDKTTEEKKTSSIFFLKYLRIASLNIYKNVDTIQTSIQFKNDLYKYIFLNKSHKTIINFSNIYQQDFQNFKIKDFYRYLFDKMSLNDNKQKCLKKARMKLKGEYLTNNKLNFFKPRSSISDDGYQIYLANHPIAVVCLDFIQNPEINLSFIILEIDLLKASGYLIVLCIHIAVSSKFIEEIFNLIKDNKFGEIHFILEIKDVNRKESENVLRLLNSIEIQSHFYFYFHYIEISEKFNLYCKKLKGKPFFHCIYFSFDVLHSIKYVNLKKIEPFVFCKNGFDNDSILISLSNVPLYNDLNDLIPYELSSFCIASIKKSDFLYRNHERNEIFIYYIEISMFSKSRYINHDDLYLIKPDYYTTKMLYLTRTDTSTVDIITAMQEQLSRKNSNTEEFKKEFIFSLFKNKKIQQVLVYVSYAYSNYIFNRSNKDFHVHDNQLFTALDACKSCLFDSSQLDDNGIVYQVDTGEGKSCIICLIASLLALMKKTVHIASSNIALANRDYHDSYLFFQKLGLKSAVLLHYNELPINNDNNDNNDFKYNPDFFPDEYFKKNLFKNSSNMNFYVCGIGNDNEIVKNKANVVFSTFVNFECLYLHLMEKFPAYINNYYKNCSLLIDEADSILIDELTNGTILSRPVKSNGNEILEFIYKSWMQKKPQEIVFKEIKSNWPKCTDLSLDDINDIYDQINLVNQDEFKNGKKYSIETIEIKEKISLEKILENSKEFIKDAKNVVQKVFKFKKNDKNIIDNRKNKLFKYIVPFDYSNKGILEPNKEFSGFVHQLIGIKEKLNNSENQNMIIKEASLNYLYVSHPIFVSYYNGVCGLTGTIGNKYNKTIYKKHYKLITKKIPRNLPNYLVEFPIILCDTIEERNNKIAFEAITLSKRKNPVIVIFQDLSEISSIFNILISQGIQNIFIFDGINNQIKPDEIAGVEGTVSLGTNVCGRGTNIKVYDSPLHVIVAYYSSNSRVMHQAFGRTARQGNPGSVRIICLKEQFISPIKTLNDKSINNYLNYFQNQNEIQTEFIEKYRVKRSWIFSGEIKSQKLTSEIIAKLRKAKINVNRIKAFDFEFPICMNYQTFLDIQAQRIFSLFNCPNCKYTWMLFQKYIREMILESWSLFIEKAEKNYANKKSKVSYVDYLHEEVEKLYKAIDFYLPEKNYDIVPTFMHIFKIVQKKYEDEILSLFPKKISQCLKQVGKKRFCSFTIGFKPFSLINESGARISSIDGKEQKQNYIKDPELKYLQKYPDHYYSILSITNKIDGIFNVICQKINDLIGSYIGLKFFLRRTLGGCEFGVCFDFNIETINENNLNDKNCLIDKDPLFLFTISVKSMVPILAGILIIGLVYIASVAKSIFEWIANFSGKALATLLKKTLKEIALRIASSQISRFINTICEFLSSKLQKQIDEMKIYKQEIANFFKLLLKIVTPKDFSFSGDTVKSFFNDKVNINMNFANQYVDNIPIQQFLKVGFLLMLCFASFMMNFHFHKHSVKYDNLKVSSEYDENQDVDSALSENINVIKKDKIKEKADFDFKE